MHLSDCFLELLTFVRYVADSPELAETDYATVRADVALLIERLEQRARDEGIPREQFDMARFAVFAWVDEAVLCSDWPGAREWLHATLQREHYGTVNAGEEFFERLDAVLRQCGGQAQEESPLAEFARESEHEMVQHCASEEVLEVYTLCLSLGFTGMYFNEGDGGRLEELRRDCLARIVGRQTAAGLDAFPEAYGSGGTVRRKPRYHRVFDPLSIVFVILPLLVAAGIYIAYRGLLEYGLNRWFG